MTAALSAALDYAARDWPVFPCRSPTKIPLIKDWGAAASTDLGQIRQWWSRWPDALIGVPTGKRSDLVVLDIDVKKPTAYGFDTLADLGLAILPETPMAHTASGGLHIYFRCHPQVEIRNSAGALGPGLDVRGEGGFAVVPSPGGGYSWDPHWNLSIVPLHPAPAWLGHRSRPQRHVEIQNGCSFDPLAALKESCGRIRSAPDGQKHDVLNRESFRIGTLVGSRLLPQTDAWNDLEAATGILIRTSDADPARTWRFLEVAFRDGLNAPRRAAT